MTKTALLATAAGSLILAAPAMASDPSVTVSTDAAACKAHVHADLPKSAGIQVNVNNRGTQDDGRLLNDTGDAIAQQAGSFDYDFTLPKGMQYVIGVQTFNPRHTAPVVSMDCRNPLEPQIIEKQVIVPGPERIVPGPTKTITKRVKVKQKVVCEHRWSRKTHRIVIVKGTCHKPPKRHVRAKAPGMVSLPAFTG